jgi:PAS domain S-box-containing protein
MGEDAMETEKRLTDFVFRSAAEATSTGVLITDPSLDDNPIIYVNPYFQKMTGYAEDEIRGRNCRFLQGPGSDRNVIRTIHEAIRSEINFRGEILNYRKDGSTFWNNLTISPAKDQFGITQYFIGIQQDVTAQKTALLERDKVISELTAINSVLTRFAQTTSHELKNPLSAIIGFANILRERYVETLAQEGQHLVERIEANAKYLNRCLDDLRQFGALGNSPITLEPVNLSELIGEVVQILGIRSDENFVHYSDKLPTVMCNRQLMTQVFRNLVDNAVKYGMAKERGMIIEATRHREECEIRVMDRGPGVQENLRDSIFDPFVSTATSVKVGSGLGLAIVKKIIELHNGTIECVSSSSGTTFLIRLPHCH